ncbi:hypothetical protein [Rhizobium sp. Nf11,1]|uniref:hypothetical protein n=1 Tax=Rhizobium sp. Nf11,1 TaxID=3404923 RepID=UPI003D3337DE
MKFDTVEIVTKEAFVEHLFGKVEQNHKTTKTGNKRHGGIRATADHYGVPEGEISMILNGGRNPSARVLEAEGLEKKVVYVRKEKRDA